MASSDTFNRVFVTGTGRCLPGKPVSNKDLIGFANLGPKVCFARFRFSPNANIYRLLRFILSNLSTFDTLFVCIVEIVCFIRRKIHHWLRFRFCLFIGN
jgi:hypothetical protein